MIKARKNGKSCVLITVVQKEGSGPSYVGAKMLVTEDEEKGTIGGGALEYEAILMANEVLTLKKSLFKRYNLGGEDNSEDYNLGMVCGGSVSLFFEYISANENIYIFGAGHIGKAMSYHLKGMNYEIFVLDDRTDMLNKIEDYVNKVNLDYDNMEQSIKIKDNSFILVATPSHSLDFAVMKKIYEMDCNPAYLGIVASKKKVDVFIQALYQKNSCNLDISNLYMPAGLDVGGRTPNEIAISIIAQMQAVRYKKEGHKEMRGEYPNGKNTDYRTNF